MIGFVLSLLFMAVAAAQEGADTNGDGVADDFDGDGMADDLDGDCIPDDFNGDGIPDGDATDFVCPEGKGGTLPTQLSLQQVARVLEYIFIRFRRDRARRGARRIPQHPEARRRFARLGVARPAAR